MITAGQFFLHEDGWEEEIGGVGHVIRLILDVQEGKILKQDQNCSLLKIWNFCDILQAIMNTSRKSLIESD